MVLYKVPCRFCAREKIMNLTDEQYEALGRFNSGEGHIQDLLPELSAEDREMFISGMCPDCWDKTFSSGEDDDV